MGWGCGGWRGKEEKHKQTVRPTAVSCAYSQRVFCCFRLLTKPFGQIEEVKLFLFFCPYYSHLCVLPEPLSIVAKVVSGTGRRAAFLTPTLSFCADTGHAL